MSLFEESLVALRRYRDFRGRSTRTQLVAFWLLTMVAGVAAVAAASLLEYTLFPHARLTDIAPVCVQWGALVPWAALGARRLHDRGWSGWWLLLLVPGVVTGMLEQYYVLTRDFDALFREGFRSLNLAAFAPAMPVLVLFMHRVYDELDGPLTDAIAPIPR